MRRKSASYPQAVCVLKANKRQASLESRLQNAQQLKRHQYSSSTATTATLGLRATKQAPRRELALTTSPRFSCSAPGFRGNWSCPSSRKSKTQHRNLPDRQYTQHNNKHTHVAKCNGGLHAPLSKSVFFYQKEEKKKRAVHAGS